MRPVTTLYAWQLFAAIFPLLCSGLSIRRISTPSTDRPTPGTAIFFETSGTLTADDPEIIDIRIHDTDRGNFTVIFSPFNISRDADRGFDIPDFLPPGSNYIIRMVDGGSDKRVLADSETFQIYPPGTLPSPSFGVSDESPISSPIPSPSSSEPAEEENEGSKLPIGTIVGGAVGGFAILVLFFVLLYLLLKRPRKEAAPEEGRGGKQPKPGDKDYISPFIIPTANSGADSSQPESIPLTASTRSRTDFISAASEKARLRAQTQAAPTFHNPITDSGGVQFDGAASSTLGSSDHLLASPLAFASSSSGDSKGSSSKVAAMRAEHLRRERERIDREIAELENLSMYSGSTSTRMQQNDDVLAQIAALRDQVSRMERDRGTSGYAPTDEPPPQYVPR